MTNPFNTEQGAEIGDRLNPLVAGSGATDRASITDCP